MVLWSLTFFLQLIAKELPDLFRLLEGMKEQVSVGWILL